MTLHACLDRRERTLPSHGDCLLDRPRLTWFTPAHQSSEVKTTVRARSSFPSWLRVQVVNPGRDRAASGSSPADGERSTAGRGLVAWLFGALAAAASLVAILDFFGVTSVTSLLLAREAARIRIPVDGDEVNRSTNVRVALPSAEGGTVYFLVVEVPSGGFYVVREFVQESGSALVVDTEIGIGSCQDSAGSVNEIHLVGTDREAGGVLRSALLARRPLARLAESTDIADTVDVRRRAVADDPTCSR